MTLPSYCMQWIFSAFLTYFQGRLSMSSSQNILDNQNCRLQHHISGFGHPKTHHFCSKKIWEGQTPILQRPIQFLQCLDKFGAAPISNAILWTHFVTPRGDQPQQDQTKHLSYCKKEGSKEQSGLQSLLGPCTLIENGGTSTRLKNNQQSMPLLMGRLACPVPNQ